MFERPRGLDRVSSNHGPCDRRPFADRDDTDRHIDVRPEAADWPGPVGVEPGTINSRSLLLTPCGARRSDLPQRSCRPDRRPRVWRRRPRWRERPGAPCTKAHASWHESPAPPTTARPSLTARAAPGRRLHDLAAQAAVLPSFRATPSSPTAACRLRRA